MRTGSLARRYAPLAALAAIQLLIIAVVPSRAPNRQAAAGATLSSGAGGGAVSAGGGATDVGAGGATPSAAGGGSTAVGGGGGPANAGGGGGNAAAGGGTTGASAPPGVNSTDTSHCVAGRTFDPKIAFYAPPCVPGTPGGKFSDNKGATWQGVTPDTITIVDYLTNYGAEVNAILQAEGLYESYSQGVVLDKAFQGFINKHFVLYGRQVKIIPYQGQCQSVPPDYQCLLPEMDKIVQTYHPYIVFWNTTLCSACYAELARDHTIGIGGDGFSDAFTNANAPFFYSGGESSSRIETAFAQFYCNQLSSANVPTRKVKWAETQNPAQNFNGQPRRLGVISTNDPDNENTVKNVLGPALARYCGDKIWHTYFYAQDINTAAQQVAAGIAAMDTPTDPANIVLCLCDPVAPAFLFEGEQDNNYYPENVIATDQSMDLDNTAQSYGPGDGGSPSLGCPAPQKGCEYDNAFGLAQWGPQQPQENDEGVRIYRDGGGQGNTPVTPITATGLAKYWVMIANLIQNAGPLLTPANMQARAPAMGTMGGGATGEELLSFAPNNWNWTQDTRVVYWSKGKTSSYNHKPGTYVQIEGNRFNLGQFPSLPDGPPIPANR